jgi:4-hydroxythreonine-4-phosphate dehydrogenase
MAIAISIGDPAGIGADIALSAYTMREALSLPPFYIIGDREHLEQRAKHLGLKISLSPTSPNETAEKFKQALPYVQLTQNFISQPACPNASDAVSVCEAIELGVTHCLDGQADALVTCPIHKKSLYDAGFKFPGHTEFLAHLCQYHGHKTRPPVMMLASEALKAVPLTIHIPLCQVMAQIDQDLIVETALTIIEDMRHKFGISQPRLAFAGLNPHAGEEGSMGMEEIEVIQPAVHKLKAMGHHVLGPLPADTMFHKRAREAYDVAICMYHDQALIPAKTLAFDEGVNVTLGLPFIRTSPDHGTAYDIAGTGKARPDSLIEAIRLAHQLAENKKKSGT